MPTAPNERINIRYIHRKNSAQEESIELPLKILTIGNFRGDNSAEPGHPINTSSDSLEDTPLSERQPCGINQHNFHQVMAAQNITLDIRVENHLSPGPQPADLDFSLSFRSLADFHPDALIENIDELHRLQILRELLSELRNSSHSPQQVNKIIRAIKAHLLPQTPVKQAPTKQAAVAQADTQTPTSQ